MLTYSELLKNRRAIRDFTDKKVSKETIREILKDACIAPSACNNQPWYFVVIQDQKVMKKLSDESKKNILHNIETNPHSDFKRFEDWMRDSDKSVFYNAPCLIIVVGKKDYNWLTVDCSLCVAYLMFAAAVRKLGTCWIGLGGFIEDSKLRKEIGLSEEYQIIAPIILGYPKEIPTMPERKEPVILNARL